MIRVVAAAPLFLSPKPKILNPATQFLSQPKAEHPKSIVSPKPATLLYMYTYIHVHMYIYIYMWIL